MKKKAKRALDVGQTAYLLLRSPVLSQMVSDDNYLTEIATFIALEKRDVFEQRFLDLLTKPRFKKAFNITARRIEDFTAKPLFRDNLTYERLWQIYKCHFIDSAELLTKYVSLKKELELAFLTGRYDAAEKALEGCESTFGESLWTIRTRILLLAYQGRNNELSEYCASCKKRAEGTLLAYIFNCYQLITDTDNPSIHLKTLIDKTSLEFKEANFNEVSSLLEILFIPDPLKGNFEYFDCLARIQSYPLIDQYNLILEILQRAVADSIKQGGALFPELESMLADLANSIRDPVLEQAKHALLGKQDHLISPAGKRLLDNYESGNYNAVIHEFRSSLSELENPITYVNLVAKAQAYLGLPGNIAASETIIENLIEELTLIYALSPLWMQAEESIISTAIKLRSFSFNAALQLTLHKAMPHRRPADDAEVTANRALISNPETTPLASALGSSKTPAKFGSRYCFGEQPDLPIYRQIKRQICKAVLENDDGVDVEAAFEQLKRLSPLRKDYLDLYVEYCLYTEQYERLIEVAANTLVRDFNLYICFPMRRLVEKVETDRFATLEAIIVTYFFLRYEDPNKDYVLNEAFEEFILGKGAHKPSEILNNKGLLTDLEIFFYKNVCIPEVMDFLSCFKDTNELRAERVRILDLLLERAVVESDERMREVEEIVSQVIVDAGTSEFNGPKIYVDDTALKKKHAQEIKALFSIYKQTKETGDDRVTILEEEKRISGKVQAYVSGNRNAIVLKMLNILMEAFLFDEKHGLDKNLSAEIRHGFFSNLMRARLEEHHLITEVDETGTYKENTFWIEANQFVNSDLLSEIDRHFKEFSAAFDSLVAEAEEWMKIVTDADNQTRIFAYAIDMHDFQSIKGFVENANDSERIPEFVFKILWNLTEEALERIREKLNGEFRDRADKLFEQLESKIRESKKNVAFVELMKSIVHARSEIKEDITTAAEWFKRTENQEIEARTLDRVVEIAINSFEKVKGAAFAIVKSIPTEFRSVAISSAQVKPFIIAITNLLDNCYRHSGLGQATRVEISGALTEESAKIEIKNNISADKMALLDNAFLVSIDKKMRNPEAGTLMRTEGGSGITKAYIEIASFSHSSNLHFARDGSHFSAVINYG